MAKKKAKTDADSARKLLKRVHERYPIMQNADEDNRKAAAEDLRFTFEPGYQWTTQMKDDRGQRPCYEFNELRIKVKRVINDMRANRPAAKVRGYEDSDKGTADILEGLGRNLWNNSDGDTIIDHAAEYQVGGGMGCWRVCTGYQSDESFDQDVYVEAIRNPFCLYWDPAAQDPLKRDAEDWILTERISKSAFEQKYPDAEPVDFESSEFDDDDDWGTEEDAETVRVAEYWYKEPKDRELWQLTDGRVVEADDPASKDLDPQLVAKKRTAKSHRIMMAIVSGNAVLEGPKEWAGREFPFVVVFGEEVVLEGKNYWFGLPRFAKDAQRNLNITQTAALEQTARSLQSPFWATTKQAEGLGNLWADAIKKGYPFLPYNVDPLAPGPPARMAGPDMPAAMLALSSQSSALLDSVSGVYAANLGEKSNEKSGRAIVARQQQGEIATFNYQDNMSKGVQRTWEIFLDLIPRIYDTERSLRILGSDDSETYEKVNQIVVDPATNTRRTVNDITRGQYDVTVTSGPSFSTKRQEATELYAQMFEGNPMLQQIASDLWFKATDLPYSDDIAERFKAMLPPQIQAMINKDKQQPPEVAQGMAQVQAAAQQVQQHGQLVQKAAEEAQQEKAGADKAKSDVQIAIANLKTQQAQFEAQVSRWEAEQAKQQAEASTGQSDATHQQYGEVIQRLGDTVAQLEARLSTLGQHTAAAVSEVHQAANRPTATRPRLAAVRIKHMNGEMVGIPQYEAQ